MRLNLGGQHILLGLSLQLFFLPHLGHQRLDPVHHHVEGIRQSANLIPGRNFHAHAQIPGPDSLHSAGKAF